MDIRDALEAFLVQLAADGRSGHTSKQYARHVRRLIGWLTTQRRSTDLSDLTPAVVASFLASTDATTSARGGAKKATSTNALRTSLRCFLRWAHDAELAPSNAARMIRRARCSPPPPRGLHDDEQRRLLAVLAQAKGTEELRDRALIELLLGTGIRIGSAIALNVEDLDLAHGELTVSSTKNACPTRTLIPKTTAEHLRNWIGDRKTGPLFTTNGRRMSIRHAQRRVTAWMQAAGITGRSPHSLRHAFATRLLSQTGDLRLVQAALGHRSIASTTVYASVAPERLRMALQA